jgi:hypothetical protein
MHESTGQFVASELTKKYIYPSGFIYYFISLFVYLNVLVVKVLLVKVFQQYAF